MEIIIKKILKLIGLKKNRNNLSLFNVIRVIEKMFIMSMISALIFLMAFVDSTEVRFSNKNNYNPITDWGKNDIEIRIQAILDKLTIEEKIFLIAGSKTHMGTNGISDKGIPALNFSDGPMGVHTSKYSGTAYPALICLAASFDKVLANKMGKSIGKDFKTRGVHVALAPGVNIYRMPNGGRNFEYLGEDPFAASRFAVAYIKGMQSEGTAATVKHFACNFQEYNRHGVSSNVDERTLREVYLPTFEAAVKEADVAAVMTAYNPVNGEHASENNFLIKDILKKEWAFDGVVMSDWTSTYHVVQAANHGLDLEMPTGKIFNKENLIRALKNGTVTIADINDKVKRLLRMMAKFGWLDKPELTVVKPFNNEESESTALEVARGGIVLLKNDHILPIDTKRVKKIAVIGYQAGNKIYSGGGSAKAYPDSIISLVDALKEQGGKEVEISWYAGTNPWRFEDKFKTSEFSTPDGKPGLKVELFSNNSCTGDPTVVRTDDRLNDFWMEGAAPDKDIREELFSVRWTGTVLPNEDGEHVFYSKCSDGGYRFFINDVLMVDTWNSEISKPISTFKELKKGVRVNIKIEYRKARHWAGMMMGWEPTKAFGVDYSKILQAASDADLVIFSGGFTDAVESEGFDRDFAMPKSVEQLLLAVAQRNPNIIVALYAGGGLDMSRWIDKVKGVIHLWYPGMNGAKAAAEILFGKINPSGKLPITIEKKLSDNAAYECYFDSGQQKNVQLCDGVFGGYKHFDKINIKPMFPFGFGLSFTTFKYSKIKRSFPSMKHNGSIKVSCSVTNTGSRAGSETLFLFLSSEKSSLPRPVKELKGFEKVALSPGETKEINFEIKPESLRFFDPINRKWVSEPGTYDVIVAASSDPNEKEQLKCTFEYE